MRNQVLTAMLMGVAIWSSLAFQVEAPKPAHRIVKPSINPANLVIPCGEEHKRVCRARERTGKVKQL
jgi:hypothetical protein